MRRTPRRVLAFVALAALAASPACGDSGDGEAAAASDAVEVRIEDFAYQPATLRVSAGTTVTFTNEDTFAHTVTAENRSYDSKNLDEGAAFDHTYDEAGTYEFFCAIHNSMTGSVVVE